LYAGDCPGVLIDLVGTVIEKDGLDPGFVDEFIGVFKLLLIYTLTINKKLISFLFILKLYLI
jgi:hypothetical protein